MAKLTRRRLLAAVPPIVVAAGGARVALGDDGTREATHMHGHHSLVGHAAMVGESAPAPGGPHDLDALLEPPPALPHQPGRVREYRLTAVDRMIEIAQGVFFPGWTYNGTIPGPVIRATQDDLLRVHFTNGGSHPHTIHFHGIHPANMDGDFEINFYTVNGLTFYYAKYPIRVRRGETVRIYLANLTEFDLINSFHLHGDFFRYYPTGSSDHFEYTDTVMLCQGQRGIIEIDFANTGRFMFHAHQSEFTDLGWMGFFDVAE